MAKQSGNPEIDALLNIPGAKQVNNTQGTEATTTPPPIIPPQQTTPATPPVTEPPKNVPDTETIRTAMLNEMFGEQFKTVEDVKKANIPGTFKELETLRQRTQELETQLKAKPKHAFASDDLAKMNEFVRETGINDVTVFKKINGVDMANISDMDALVLQHIIENPTLANKEPQVRAYFERKYNVDPLKVESGDLTQEELDVNLIGVTSDGGRAKTKLQELKGKIKMPEVPVEEPSKKWTPEIEARQKSEWTKVNEVMGQQLATIPIRIKGSTEPIVNFVVPEETRKAVLQSALDFAVSNQMEINEANITPIAKEMYTQIIVSNLDQITHAVFERARSMTQEDALKLYHNPSPKSGDTPPPVQKPLTAEERRKAAAEAEMKGII